MQNNLYCVIMAGGIGSRFWPVSRRSRPKQFLDILGTGKSFLRMAYERMLPLVAPDHFVVVTNEHYRALVREQLPELTDEQILGEPIGRNTAPCVCYAAFAIRSRDPNAVMIVTPADHYITEEPKFLTAIKDCIDFVGGHNALMTVGIAPQRPETGYGYIQISDKQPISRVKSFTEKPNLELAQTFLECGEFFWNAGVFVWKVGDIIEAVKLHLPDYYALFNEINATYGTAEEAAAIERVYSICRPISIDYGVMEKADNAFVRCGEFGWSDIGTWGSFYQHVRKDAFANAKPAKGCYTYGTRSCIVSLPKDKIAVISGLRDYIVVDTDDVLMICPRSEEQTIKKFIDDVKFNGGDDHI